MPDVDRLLSGYTTAGNWSLGQICRHLSTSMRFTVEGAPRMKWWTKALKWTIGPMARRRFFRTKHMPEGFRMPTDALDPKPGLDDRAEAEALRATIRLFLASDGPFGDHPIFGNLSPEEWRRFHAIHCAHHLSFALPKESVGPVPRDS